MSTQQPSNSLTGNARSNRPRRPVSCRVGPGKTSSNNVSVNTNLDTSATTSASVVPDQQIAATSNQHAHRGCHWSQAGDVATHNVTSSSNNRHQAKRGEIPCRMWQKNATCPKGDKCWFGHDPQILEAKRLREEHAERRRKEAQEHAENQQKRLLLVEEEKRARENAAKLHKAEIARREAALTVREFIFDSTLVTFSAGLEVQDIMTGFQSCRIIIKNLPRNVKEAEVYDIFTQQGIERNRIHIVRLGKQQGDDQKREAEVLCNAEQGRTLATGLEGVDFRDETLQFQVKNASVYGMGSSGDRINAEELTMTWYPPSYSVVVDFVDLETARSKAQVLNDKMLGDQKVKVQLNRMPVGHVLRYFNPNSIKIIGIPMHVLNHQIAEFAGSFLIRRLKGPQSYDVDNAFIQLRSHMNTIAYVTHFEISNPGADGKLVAKARFGNWDDAKKVHDALLGQKFHWMGNSNFHLWLPTPHRYRMTIFPEQYSAQKELWDSLANSIRGNQTCSLRVQVDDRVKKVFILVAGSDEKVVGSLKVRVEHLAAGERLHTWHSSLLLKSQDLLREIGETTGTFLRFDWRAAALKVYGTDKNVQDAQKRVEAEVSRLAALEYTKLVAPKSVAFFLRQGIRSLQERFGEDAANLDVRTRRIVVKGGENVRQALENLIEESLQETAIRTEVKEEVVCPICYSAVSSPLELICGHEYCTACFHHFMTTATDGKTFPLACMGDEGRCQTPISVPVIQKFLTRDQFRRLLKEAFTTYVEQHGTEIKYCPTPDCSQLYCVEKSAAPSELQCPSCFFGICSSCGQEAHTGMSCEERNIGANTLTDRWATANDARKCPSCQILIQKTDGCNHMTCRCGAHICWKCMKIFRPENIYGHMASAHGSIWDDNNVAYVVEEQREPEAVDQVLLFEQIQIQRHWQRELEARRLRNAQLQRRVDERIRLREAELEANRIRLQNLQRAQMQEAQRQQSSRGWCIVM